MKKGKEYMAKPTTNISIRMDSELKAEAESLFNELGMNLTTAFNIFVRQSLREGGIPFDVNLRKLELIDKVITTLALGENLPNENRDHDLHGNWKGYRECHIQPDWLLIYKIEKDILVLTLTRTGTHSDLFAK